MLDWQTQTPSGDKQTDQHKKTPATHAHHKFLDEVKQHAQTLLKSKVGHAIKEGVTNEGKKVVKNETDGAAGGVDLVKTVVHSAKTGHVDTKDLTRAAGDAGKVISATPVGVHKMIIVDAATEGAKLLPKSVQPTVHKVEKVIEVKKDIKSGNVNKILNGAINDTDIYKSVHQTPTALHAKS